MKLLVFSLCIFCLLLSGCEKPYSMLNDQEKIVRTFSDYVQALKENKYERAYSFLSFVHIPKGGNKNQFVQAQKIMDKMFSEINYEVTKLHKATNVAVIDVTMLYTHPNKMKTKTETQVFLHKNGKKWEIVTGIYPVRMQLTKIYPSMLKHFKLKPDISYIQKDGKWIIPEPKEKPSPSQTSSNTK